MIVRITNEDYSLQTVPEVDLSGYVRFVLASIPGPEVIKLFNAQQSITFIMLINVKMTTIVGILTIMSMINTTSESFEARIVFAFKHFNFCELLNLHAELS